MAHFLAPVLHLQELTSLFSLFVTEEEAYALGILGYQLGPSFVPVVYLLKTTKTNKNKTPIFYHSGMGTLSSLLVNQKLTFGSPTTIFSHHSLSNLLTYKGLKTLLPEFLLYKEHY